MALVLLLVGIVFLTSSVLGTQAQLFTLLKGDFTGQDNFVEWGVAVVFIGAVGYIPGFKPLANSFFVLLVIALLIANRNGTGGGGFFAQLQAAIKGTATAGTNPATPAGASGAMVSGVAQSTGGIITLSPAQLQQALFGTTGG